MLSKHFVSVLLHHFFNCPLWGRLLGKSGNHFSCRWARQFCFLHRNHGIRYCWGTHRPVNSRLPHFGAKSICVKLRTKIIYCSPSHAEKKHWNCSHNRCNRGWRIFRFLHISGIWPIIWKTRNSKTKKSNMIEQAVFQCKKRLFENVTFEQNFADFLWRNKVWKHEGLHFFIFSKNPIRHTFNISSGIKNQIDSIKTHLYPARGNYRGGSSEKVLQKTHAIITPRGIYPKMKFPNRNFQKSGRALRFSGLKMELQSSKNQVFTIRKFKKTQKISRISMTLIFFQWKLSI